MSYYLVGITRTGGAVRSKGAAPRAPSDKLLVEWGLKYQCCYVARYYPSKKGWVWSDIRGARRIPPGPHAKSGFWIGVARGSHIHPTEDAAVMHLLAVLSKRDTLDFT